MERNEVRACEQVRRELAMDRVCVCVCVCVYAGSTYVFCVGEEWVVYTSVA